MEDDIALAKGVEALIKAAKQVDLRSPLSLLDFSILVMSANEFIYPAYVEQGLLALPDSVFKEFWLVGLFKMWRVDLAVGLLFHARQQVEAGLLNEQEFKSQEIILQIAYALDLDEPLSSLRVRLFGERQAC